MKVTIAYDHWEGKEEYPGEASSKRKRRPKLDREEIAAALEKHGHDVSLHVVDGQDASLLALAKTREDLIFNLVESYGGDDTKDMHFGAYLDLLGKRYTGSGPHALLLAQDKAVTKKIIRFHGLYSPYSAVSYRGRVEFAQDIQFPLIVKPVAEDGSIGIDAGSVVTTVRDLMERIDWIHSEFDAPALIEEFIEGREIYVGVLGNDAPEALPPVELDLSRLPEGMPKIAGYEVKFEHDTEAYRNTKSRVAEDLSEETVRQLQETAVTAYRALRLRDYGRIDMRLRADGRIFILEANPNPWLSSSAELAMAARAAGRTYPALIEEIVGHAVARYG